VSCNGIRYLASGEKMLLRSLTLVVLLFTGLLPAQASERPNILFITIDDLNNDLGAYGHELVQSPNIDRLAAAGVRYERAYSQTPLCTPSRSSFLTGLYPDQTGIIAHGSHTRLTPHFRDHVPGVTTLPQLFREQGWFSARVGKIFHQGVPSQIGTPGADDPASWDTTVNPIGIDKLDESGIQSWNKRAMERRSFGGTLSWQAVGRDEDHTDYHVASGAIDLMKEYHPAKTGKPFFLGVGFYRPHTPYVAPQEYFDLYALEDIEPYIMPANDRNDIPAIGLTDRAGQLDLTVAQRKVVIRAYYAAVSFMDAQVGRVLDALDDLGLADSTIVVFVSDHGYELGQHGLWQKGSLFEGSARIPMIIRAPGMKAAGKAAGSPVEMVDVYRTLTDLAGIEAPGYVMGRSLRPTLDDADAVVRTSALSSILSRVKGTDGQFAFRKIRGHSIRTERYRYTEWGGGLYGAELYDHENDPEELTNLADKTSLEGVRIKLKWMLDDRIAEAGKRVSSIESRATPPD
jgi:arylsulfatase A-like enzyme